MEEFNAESQDEVGSNFMALELLQWLMKSDTNSFELKDDADDNNAVSYDYNEDDDCDVNKLLVLDTNDYKIIWLHSDKTSQNESRSWIETRLRMIFPRAEFFSNSESCLLFLELLPRESKLFFLGNGNDHERFRQAMKRFSTCHLLWNRASIHTNKSFNDLQEIFVKIRDEEDEKDDLTRKEKYRQAMDNYAIIFLYENPFCKSFDDIQFQLSTVFERLVSFNNQNDCFNYVESVIDTNTPIFLILYNCNYATISITTKTIKAIYHIKSVLRPLPKPHFHDVKQLILVLRRDIRALTDDFPFSIIEYSTRQLDPLRAPYTSFMGIMDVLISLTRNDERTKAKQDFLTSCRAAYTDNPAQLQAVERFAQEYQHFEQAIGWYTRDSFVYRLVNQAMRSQNPDIIYKYRFFINDLIRHLDTLYEATKQDVPKDRWLVVYRGQGMRLKELNKLKRHIGQEFALNSFYSATLDRDMAMEYALVSTNGLDILSVLVVLHMDRTLVHIRPFACVEHFSVIPAEREVLISMGSVFRLESIEFSESSQVSIITLILVEFNKDDIKSLRINPTTNKVSLVPYEEEERPVNNEDSVPPFFRAAMHDTFLVNEYIKEENEQNETIEQEASRLKASMEGIFQIYGKRK